MKTEYISKNTVVLTGAGMRDYISRNANHVRGIICVGEYGNSSTEKPKFESRMYNRVLKDSEFLPFLRSVTDPNTVFVDGMQFVFDFDEYHRLQKLLNHINDMIKTNEVMNKLHGNIF